MSENKPIICIDCKYKSENVMDFFTCMYIDLASTLAPDASVCNDCANRRMGVYEDVRE